MDSRFPVQTINAISSVLNEALDLMRSLAIIEGSLPNYAQPSLGAESGEFHVPPTTHFIATVEDLNDTLDYDSEDIYGMDNDTGDEKSQNPPFTGRWTATSSYDVYMVDTPKEDDGENGKNLEDEPAEAPTKRRHQRRRSKSCHEKDSNTGTRDNNTPDNAKDQEAPVEPTSE